MELRDRPQLEAQFARRMARLNGRHRNELANLLGDPPNFANVTEAFWQRVREEEAQELLALMLLIFATGAIQHGASAEEANRRAQVWAQLKSSQIAAERSNNLRAAVADMAHEKPTATEVREQLNTIFSPSEAERIAITNTTDAGTSGAEWAVDDQDLAGPDDTWRTERDGKVCPVCRPLDGAKRDVWSSKFPEGPPAHERCRCEIVYANAPVLNRRGELQPAV